MNKIQRIQQFLKDYQSLNPYLKNLLKDNYDDYQDKLRIEFLKVSRHPYPNEYLRMS